MQKDCSFSDFFHRATGHAPFPFQTRWAVAGKSPQLVSIPTGLGKTAGAVCAWLWRRRFAADEVRASTPRRLVYCLPMRVLVEQTHRECVRILDRLGLLGGGVDAKGHYDPWTGDAGDGKIRVFSLMGTALDRDWDVYPEADAILVGTQDQLLSRALNRGYGMSRFRWPTHFGLLNQDCHWIIDEVQLMGPGLWTTAQLDWMRQKRFASMASCLTTWMSATVGTDFLETTDRKRDALGRDHDSIDFDPKRDIGTNQDTNPELKRRYEALRRIDWFGGEKGSFTERLAREVATRHVQGTLSLVVCNTVETARAVFRALPNDYAKILLTSRFRRQDRDDHIKKLLEFEALRQAEEKKRDDNNRPDECGKPISDNAGLICVSTQVVEAGVDVSAHQLWSELTPWPSVIQRLGRLNRDGRDQKAQAWVWKTPKQAGRSKETRIGPYETGDISLSEKLLTVLVENYKSMPFAQAVEKLKETCGQELNKALQPKHEPMPRALDVHGLFSTEPDLHGGFTDVSPFIRGADPDADLTVFWREWDKGDRGASPPSGDDLDGPPLDLKNEGCPVPFYRLSEKLKSSKAKAWVWNEDADSWEYIAAADLRPGMVVMLHRSTGGYDIKMGWTGEAKDKLDSVPPAGQGQALRDDAFTENGYWGRLDAHLSDAKVMAEKLCDALNLKNDNEKLRTAVVQAAALHDLGKLHPRWQEALPAAAALTGGPWAKCPRVLAFDATSDGQAVRDAVHRIRPDAVFLGSEQRQRGRRNLVRLRWAVGQRLTRDETASLSGINGVIWVGHVPFRLGLRHEAASALAMWKRYREGEAAYPALAVYLAAAHHGKVRTVLRSTTDSGGDVFGVPHEPAKLENDGELWPLDFSVAKDGAEGTWGDGEFVLTGHGWTGLVADLLGPWRKAEDDLSEAGVVPGGEPRRLGPFVLAYLEALVRAADWRASEKPSHSIKPAEVRHDH